MVLNNPSVTHASKDHSIFTQQYKVGVIVLACIDDFLFPKIISKVS